METTSSFQNELYAIETLAKNIARLNDAIVQCDVADTISMNKFVLQRDKYEEHLKDKIDEIAMNYMYEFSFDDRVKLISRFAADIQLWERLIIAKENEIDTYNKNQTAAFVNLIEKIKG